MAKRLFYILAILCSLSAAGQAINFDGDDKNWEVDLRGGFNPDGYQLDFGLAVFADPCIGLRMSIGFAGEWDELMNMDWDNDDWGYGYGDWGYWSYSSRSRNYYYDDYYCDYAVRFKFTPAIVLRTPRLFSFGDDESGLHIFAEPGIFLSPGASGSKDAKTFGWDVKAGINLQFSRFIVSLGYGASNFSLYSGDPYGSGRDADNYDYITHSGYIGIGFKF